MKTQTKAKSLATSLAGLTKDTGWEIGVRKTLMVPPQAVWEFITSDEGLKVWLGDVTGFRWEKGHTYTTREGTTGEVGAINPGGHFRLKWQPKHWSKASTVQVRVIPNEQKTTLSFHQENLLDADEREVMRLRWEDAIEQIRIRLEPVA
jgi:uncharacterized protein YndB with AHSA1/START domain